MFAVVERSKQGLQRIRYADSSTSRSTTTWSSSTIEQATTKKHFYMELALSQLHQMIALQTAEPRDNASTAMHF